TLCVMVLRHAEGHEISFTLPLLRCRPRDARAVGKRSFFDHGGTCTAYLLRELRNSIKDSCDTSPQYQEA
ncbi:hypothetical protein RA274_28390, partial [Pseudomonas syringae pv. tagetis]|uniref:hypothetical protein n=1 Tax=Pseudomonas syringae group genomosp. 7 TaxID=251699 RepID=UPI00376F989C